MKKESLIKSIILVGFLLLFLFSSRFKAEEKKVVCIENKCEKPHEHGELNYHERFHVEAKDKFVLAVLKSAHNFWEANATGMTFAIILGGAGLSLVLSSKKTARFLEYKGVRGAALGSLLGMPLNMCANCSAVASVGINSKSGSKEATLGIILGGALFNIIGIITMFGLFHPAVVFSRIIMSAILILVMIPLVSKLGASSSDSEKQVPILDTIPIPYLGKQKSVLKLIIKSIEDWLVSAGNLAWKLIPLMVLGTLITAVFRVFFPNEVLSTFTHSNPYLVIIVVSFIGTLLSVPVLFEILLGTVLLHLGFSNGVVATMLFTAPAFGLFTMVITKEKLGGYRIPLILIGTTFLFGITTGLLAEFLTQLF